MKVGQLKVNNNQVMCHLSMKLSDTLDQNPPCTLDKIREKAILMKTLSQLDLESKGQGHSKNQKTMPQGAINMLSTQKIGRDSPNNCVLELICQIYYK